MCVSPSVLKPGRYGTTRAPRACPCFFLARHRLAHGFDQHLCHFRAREFAWRSLACLQQLTHFCTTEGYMVIAVMRAGLGGGHGIAGAAVEGVLKEHGCNAEFRRIEFGKYVLGIIGAVIVADPGMISPHDEMRTAIVLAH